MSDRALFFQIKRNNLHGTGLRLSSGGRYKPSHVDLLLQEVLPVFERRHLKLNSTLV